MRGSVDYQMTKIFTDSGVFRPGTSRHLDKIKAQQHLEQQGLSTTSSRLAEQTGLYSYEYARDCKDTWHRLGHYCRTEYHLRDMLAITPGHVEAYLIKRIKDGISYPCWKKEAAHLGKFENALVALNGADNNHCGMPGIRSISLDAELRTMARETLSKGGKEIGYFYQPEAVIAGIPQFTPPESGFVYSLIARIQYEGGARCREACKISATQLQGIAQDIFTCKDIGKFFSLIPKVGSIAR